jgi:hypothetical protein
LSFIATASLLGACAKTDDIHATEEARNQPCFSCHASAFASAASPLHAGKFATTCGSCHGTAGWRPAALPDHHWFVLDGQHASAECAGCHTGDPARYAGTPTECAGCHQSSYDSAQHPVHANVLPNTCGDCHSKDAWSPATVTVHPWFTLDGQHLTTPCVSCHTGNPKRFAGTPSACVGCHLADYQASTFPGHAMFPQTCKDCHNTKAW